MKRFFLTTVIAILVTAGLFAATEPSWYNDVTSIANNGQYYIYSVGGGGFMEGGNSKVITATKSKTPSLFTIGSQDGGKTYSGSNYVSSYQLGTCGPVGSNSTNGSDIYWTSMSNAAYWNIHGKYSFLGTKYAALYYENNGYSATADVGGSKKAQTDSQYRWYLVSQDHYTRHWLIYDFDVLKESISLSTYVATVHQDLYTALATAMTPTFNVKTDATATVQSALTALQTAKSAADAYPALYTAAESAFSTARTTAQTYTQNEVPTAVYTLLHAYDNFTPNVVSTALTAIEAATTNLNAAIAKAEDTKTVYAASLAKITALEGVTDKGDGDIAAITTDITNARTAINQAVTSAEVTASVAGLRQIDNVTALTITFNALETLSGIASSMSGLTVTYTSTDLTTVNAALKAIKGGTCVIEAATAGDATYYPFTRRVTVTIAKLDPTVSVKAADITYPATVHSSTLTNTGTAGTVTWNEVDEKRLPGTYPGLSVHFTPTDLNVYNEADATVTLKVLPPTTYGEVFGGACPGASYYYRGNYYTPRTNPYSVTLTNYLGGDSIVTLHVAEYPTYNHTFDVTIYSDETFLWNCDTYTKEGTLTHTYMSRYGCDSTVTINLTVLPQKTYGEVLGDICSGDYFKFNDKYYTAGTYKETLVNHLGGDSIVTLTVTEHPTYEESFDVTICQGDSFLWDGNYYKEANHYTRHYQTIYGCDSAVTLNLDMLPSYTIPASMTIAAGWTETWRGKDLSGYASGDYVVYDSLKSTLDCDSVYLLNLTVLAQGPTTYGEDSAYICPGDTFTYLDTQLTDSGSYPFKLRNSVYGDSLITFYLRYWPTYKKKSNRVIHQGVSYKWRGQQLSGYDEGSYILWDSLKTSQGCDSLFYCTLTILPPETQYNEVYGSICPGDTFYFESQQFTDSGIYEIPVAEQSRYRGDSVNRIHLEWYPTYQINKRRTMYEGQRSRWHGIDLSVFPVCDTLLYDSLKTEMGCDSVYRLRLTVLEVPTTYLYDTVHICGVDSFTYCRDTVISTAGDYVFLLTNYLGGDSIVSLHVEEHMPFYQEQYDTITQGDTYYWRDRTLELLPFDHVLTDSLLSDYGCDSVYRLYLHVNPLEYKIIEEMTVCQHASCMWRGQVVPTDTAGFFREVLEEKFYSGYDADSVYVLNLTVDASPEIHFYDIWREGRPKMWYVEHFSGLTPGFYTFTSGRFLHTKQGCDSMEVMHLAVVPTIRVNQVEDLCPGQTVMVGGKTYSRAGVYTINETYIYHGYDTLNLDSLGFAGRTFYGDSIITLTVNERPNYNLSMEKYLEYGDTLWWRSAAIPMNMVGTFMYYDTTVSVYGCDSLTTLTVYVDRAKQKITWHPDTLSVHAGDSMLLHAYASSGLPVTYTSSSLFYAAVNDEGWLIGRVVGKATITASQNGNVNYYAAPPVKYNFDILEPLPFDGLDTVLPDENDTLPEGAQPVKVIRNGHLYILTPKGVFDAEGKRVE